METDDRLRPLILIADADVDTRLLFVCVLQMSGYAVADVRTGPDALEAAVELVPDLLVTEIALPDLDGFTLATRLRDTPLGDAVPVLAVTAYSRPDLSARATACGISEVLRKPCLPDDLLAAVRRVLNVHRPKRAR